MAKMPVGLAAADVSAEEEEVVVVDVAVAEAAEEDLVDVGLLGS
jgi:hypothetical protein